MTRSRLSALPAFARCCTIAFSIMLASTVLTSIASAQFVMMPDSTNNRIVLFDPFNGAIVTNNLFSLTAGTTPVHAMQVGNEVWVSEQLGDKVSRYSVAGVPLGTITGALDNLRGMEQVGNTVFLCSTGTGNGAPGRSIQMFDTTGVSQGFFPTPPSSGFGILDHQGGLLVSSDAANNDIHKWSYTGADNGVFHNSTSVNFAEQMDYSPTGAILVAGFSTNNVATLDPNTGAFITSFAAPGARGVYQLGNGNVLWTSSSGAFVFDSTAGTSTQIYTGGGRFLDDFFVPEPTTGLVLVGASLLMALRRRGR